jgi:1-acyl-sn-glycerol-3-phosphate acyltransferase
VKRWEYVPARDHGLSGSERWRSLRRELGTGELLLQRLLWSTVRGLLRVYERLRIEGRERIPPQAPLVLVSNHSSHLDVLALGSALPLLLRSRVLPIAAGDHFFETPSTAAFASLMLNALPMWRRRPGKHALQELRARLVEEPCGYILFPEGTRSRDGTIARFRPGVGMLVAETGVPVVPCHLEGAHAAWPPTARFPRPGRLRLKVGEPLVFDDVPNRREGWDQIAHALEERVRALSGESGDES